VLEASQLIVRKMEHVDLCFIVIQGGRAGRQVGRWKGVKGKEGSGAKAVVDAVVFERARSIIRYKKHKETI
jgi:hypothetical protein